MASQQSAFPREAPGGEVVQGNLPAEEKTSQILAQGLHPHVLSKSQLKKQRKQQGAKQEPPSQTQPQHYKEKVTPPQPPPTPQEHFIKKELPTEGITKSSAVEQQSFTSEGFKTEPSLKDQKTQGQTFAAPGEEFRKTPESFSKGKESTGAIEKDYSSKTESGLKGEMSQSAGEGFKKTPEAFPKGKESPIVSEHEYYTSLQSEALKEQQRSEASLMGAVREEEAERKRRMEEEEIRTRREGESEASLIGTVIDEERERQRRIDEDYPTYTEPLEKTKALEEIERRRRVHSLNERPRQQFAATACAKLFPRAVRPTMPASSLWTEAGLLKRLEPLEDLDPQPRYGQYIATTTRRTSKSDQPGHGFASSAKSQILHQKQFTTPYSKKPSEITIRRDDTAGFGTDKPMASSVVSSSSNLTSSIPSRASQESYFSQSRPRLVVRHEGLPGKWARTTETIEFEFTK